MNGKVLRVIRDTVTGGVTGGADDQPWVCITLSQTIVMLPTASFAGCGGCGCMGGGGGALFIAFLSVGTGYWSEPLRGSLSCCECKV